MSRRRGSLFNSSTKNKFYKKRHNSTDWKVEARILFLNWPGFDLKNQTSIRLCVYVCAGVDKGISEEIECHYQWEVFQGIEWPFEMLMCFFFLSLKSIQYDEMIIIITFWFSGTLHETVQRRHIRHNSPTTRSLSLSLRIEN